MYYHAGNSKQGISGRVAADRSAVSDFCLATRVETSRWENQRDLVSRLNCMCVSVYIYMSPVGHKNTFRRDQRDNHTRIGRQRRAERTAIFRLHGNKIGTRNDTRSRYNAMRCMRRVTWNKMRDSDVPQAFFKLQHICISGKISDIRTLSPFSTIILLH